MFEVHPFMPRMLGWGFIGAIIIGLLFVALLVVLIVWAVKYSRRPAISAGSNDALDIARKRYASGEISEEEFEKIKKNLS